MPETMRSQSAGKFTKLLLAANLCFWIYFAISFAQASYPFKHDPWGHPAGAGYTFLGHSIGIVESPFLHPFFNGMFWVEFPSFALARVGENLFFPHVTADQFLAGISEGGWRLLVVVLLSFLQWYLVGWVGQRFWQRWVSHPAGGVNRPAAASPMPPGATASRP
jgi:hypothetical protein